MPKVSAQLKDCKKVYLQNSKHLGQNNAQNTSSENDDIIPADWKNIVSPAGCSPDTPYIMSGSTRLARISLDTVILNFHLFKSSVGDSLFPLCADQRAVLQSTSTEDEAVFKYEKGNKYFEWNIQRVGSKLYPYVLTSGDIRLLLSTRSLETGEKPNAQLHIGSLSSQENPLAIIDRVKSWLSLFGIQVKKDSVSRVDICHDFMLSIRDKRVALFDNDKVVTKATKHTNYYSHRKLTGLQYGKGNILLRIYDKFLEVSQPHNTHKLCFFSEKWGEYIAQRDQPKTIWDVTRVEFQLRKAALNQFLKHGSFADFLNNAHSIWNYLTHDWFRHCKKAVDRKNRNQDKVETSSFWKKVQAISNVEEFANREKKVIHKKSMKGIRSQIRGLLTTFSAGCGHSHDDYQGIIRTARDFVLQEFESCFALPDWENKFKTRRNNTVLLHDDDTEQRDIFTGYSFEKLYRAQPLPF